MGPSLACALRGVAPAATTAGLHEEHVTGMDGDADFLGLDDAGRAALGVQHIPMRQAVLAAEDAASAVPHTISGGVAERGLVNLHGELQHAAGAAAELAVAATVGAEFVAAKEQRETHLRHLEAAEFDAARRLPLPGAGPAVARGRGAAAGPGLEQVPDEGPVPAGIAALDRYPEAPAPAGHGA